MTKLWVLIADSSHAEVVSVEGMGKTIEIVKHYEHPKGRAKNLHLETDRPGRTNDRVGGQRHAMNQERDPHYHERQIFARKLIDTIENGHKNKQFEQFAIIAPATFLGELNHCLSKQLKTVCTKEIPHDIITIPDPKKRHDLMCKYLDLWNHQ